jgi:Sulfotransferase family
MANAESERDGPVLVFVHIPKTAGTTLRTILNMNEPGARSRSLGNVFKGGGGLSKAPVESMRSGRGPDLKEGVRILRGHFPLGIREYLPNYLPKQKELRCFTFLREPTDRTLSHYFAIRDRFEGADEPGKHTNSTLPADPTLEDALAGGYVHDNLHTRMLCGDPEPFGEVTEEMLERAKRNLSEDLVFFGLTERFDESLVMAKRQLGLEGILYRSSGRVNPARPRGKEIPAELRRTAERCNRYDIELYRYAQELFEEALEPTRDLEFEVELAALQAGKVEGELEVSTPVPAGFGGDQEAWGMLVRATATSQRMKWERTRHRIPHVSATVQEEARENQLKAARSKATRLEREVERLRDGDELGAPRSTVRRLERELELLRGAHSRAKRLEQEVLRLTDAASKTAELERQVERLSAAAARTEKLEQQVKRVTDLRAKNKELQTDVQRLSAASSRATALEREVKHLTAANAKVEKLEQQMERLTDLRARNKDLQSEVQDLKATASRATELEREVTRLSAANAKVEKLEQQVERLANLRAKNKELQTDVQRLSAASSRATELEREVKRLTSANAKVEKLEQQVERLADVRARNKELQAEIQRLSAASARATELEREVERLKTASSKASKELEHRTERLKATQSRKQKLEEKVERLRAAKETPGVEAG